jgi:hypothetical protein
MPPAARLESTVPTMIGADDPQRVATSHPRTGAIVTVLLPNDVILGRGVPVAKWQGNKRFRDLIRTRKAQYMGTGRRHAKQQIAQDLLQELYMKDFRFLVPIQTNEGTPPHGAEAWSLAGEEVVLNKIKQALRQSDTSDSLEDAQDRSAVPRSDRRNGSNPTEVISQTASSHASGPTAGSLSLGSVRPVPQSNSLAPEASQRAPISLAYGPTVREDQLMFAALHGTSPSSLHPATSLLSLNRPYSLPFMGSMSATTPLQALIGQPSGSASTWPQQYGAPPMPRTLQQQPDGFSSQSLASSYSAVPLRLSTGNPFLIPDNVVLFPQLLNQQRDAAQRRAHEHYKGLLQRNLLEQRRRAALVQQQRVQEQIDFLVQQRARQLQDQQVQQEMVEQSQAQARAAHMAQQLALSPSSASRMDLDSFMTSDSANADNALARSSSVTVPTLAGSTRNMEQDGHCGPMLEGPRYHFRFTGTNTSGTDGATLPIPTAESTNFSTGGASSLPATLEGQRVTLPSYHEVGTSARNQQSRLEGDCEDCKPAARLSSAAGSGTAAKASSDSSQSDDSSFCSSTSLDLDKHRPYKQQRS